MIEKTFSEKLYSNLSFFKSFRPDLFERFNDYSEERYFLVFDSDGCYNVFDKEECVNLYGGDPAYSISRQLIDYANNPIYFSINYGRSSELSEKVNPVHVSYTQKIASVASDQIKNQKRSNRLPERIKNITILSTGVGLDIDYLIRNYSIGNIYILEDNFDLFYISLHFLDWEQLFELASANGCSMNLFVSDLSSIASSYHKALFDNGRFNANSMYLYNSSYVDGVDDLMEKVKQEISSVILMGFGFYDDSRLSLAASLGNIEKKIPCMTKNVTPLKRDISDVPVFLIGAGPSIDADLEFIKKNQDHAIIVSCGSGVKVLERINVVPDFHFECERTAFTYHWLEQVDNEFLRKAFYIGLNIIYPEVYDLFDRSGMVLKTFETGSILMSQASVDVYGKNIFPLITNVNPTVMHMGVGLTPIFGFRKIYLFGADMGYKDPNNHHSGFSSYSDLKDEHKSSFIPDDAKVFQVESNFPDQEVYTDQGFESFRIALEKILLQKKVFPKLEYFNCSDGALIDGAEPKKTESIVFGPELNKKEIVESIRSAYFSEPVDSLIYKAMEDRINSGAFSVFVNMSVDHFSKDAQSLEEAEDMIQSYVDKFFHDKNIISDDDSYILSLVSGSLLYYFTIVVRIMYYRAECPDENLLYFNKARLLLVEFFEELGRDFTTRYTVNDSSEYYSLF